MARETKAQRNVRIGLLLGEYKAKNEELSKLGNQVEDLKKQIAAEELQAGTTYGDWIYGVGTARNNVDNEAVREHYKSLKLELPRKLSKAPITINPKAAR